MSRPRRARYRADRARLAQRARARRSTDGAPDTRLRRVRQMSPRLEPPPSLRRGLGSPALFGIVQGFVAASVYFALGLVAEHAQGLLWLVSLGAGLFFVLLVLSYVEGASLHQERGGATVFARHGFNELWSFVAGWAICLDYVILIAITAFGTTDYAGVLWHPLDEGVPEFLLAAGLIVAVGWLNVRGAGTRRWDRAVLLVLADLALQLLVVILGLVLLFEPDVVTDPLHVGRSPSLQDFLFASTLSVVAFSGLDASSGLAGDVRIGRRGLKRLLRLRLLAAVVPLVGIALVAASALPLASMTPGSPAVERPMVEVVGAFEQSWLREPLRLVVAVFAIAILAAACNAAMLGLSRLGHSLATNRQIPSALGRLHPTHHTPFVIIAVGALLAVVLVMPADLEFLGGIYAFGATLAFTLVHLSLINLRRREPARDRPFKMPFNVRVGGIEWPLTAMAGALMSVVAFVVVVVYHASARWVGVGWLGFGLLLYVTYRLVEDKPLLRRVTVPEGTLVTRGRPDAQYGSILVPIRGTPLDDDIMQTAGRLAAEEGDEEGEGGAVIEALWVFEVPVAMPLDARVPEADLARARAALKRAKQVGEEYNGVEVATATVRGRRAGEAIVHEARRRGVEAIVLAAEEPSRMRGGTLYGGKEGLRETFVGEMTRYVVQKAPCRVILTAPPSRAADGGGDGGSPAAAVAEAPANLPGARPVRAPDGPGGAGAPSGNGRSTR